MKLKAMKKTYHPKQGREQTRKTVTLLAAAVMGLAWLGVAGPALQDWRAPARKARVKNPIPATEASIAQGRQLFMTACAPCHGPSGRGDGPAAASLERKPGNLTDGPRMWAQSDGELFWKITTGNSPMPAFEEAYTEEQRWHIVNFVRTLAPKTAVAARSTQP